MSGVLKMRGGAFLSTAGRAGPRRLAVIAMSGTAIVALVVVVALSGHKAPPASQDARMKPVDPLPGGLHSTPEMNALSYEADTRQAEAALNRGESYTPALAPSVPMFPAPATPDLTVSPPAPAPVPQPIHQPHAVAPVRIVVPQEVEAPLPTPVATPVQVIPVQAVVDPKAVEAYNKQIGDLFSHWGGRLPRTDVVLPPTERAADSSTGDPPASTGSGTTARTVPAAIPASLRSDESTGRVLVPAGRGVFAHPILALSSDQASPVVMQADSGPIAGDRMIGSFSKQGDRLVIHINSIIHQGQVISADGVVTAPDTMEASVASKIDQHYAERFILPAAAAFVAGLGQALATTSNTTAVLSPLGGATTSTNLNFHQQLGVAAGAAASQIGNTLNAEAPKGPTISLEANVSVGVMFLSNVIDKRS
jgi:intracellular multiplication protein IcmE